MIPNLVHALFTSVGKAANGDTIVNIYTGTSPIAGADEGTWVNNFTTFSCAGAGITCTDGGNGVFVLTVPGGSGGGSGGYAVEPATVQFNLAQGVTGTTFSFTGPQTSTVTFGLAVGSMTSLGAVGIGTTTPIVMLDVGGKVPIFTSPFASPPVASFSGNVNGITGIQMTNTNAGTGADFRFAILDETANYIAFMLPATGNTGTNLFQMPRKTGAFIIGSGGTTRDIGIGTISANKLVFGTTNIKRMTITASGNVGISTGEPQGKLDVYGYTVLGGSVGISGDIISKASATFAGTVGSTTGFTAPSATFTFVQITGATVCVNATTCLVFPSTTPASSGQKLGITSVSGIYHYLAWTDDAVGAGGGGGGALYIEPAEVSVSTVMFPTSDFTLVSGGGISTVTISGTTHTFTAQQYYSSVTITNLISTTTLTGNLTTLNVIISSGRGIYMTTRGTAARPVINWDTGGPLSNSGTGLYQGALNTVDFTANGAQQATINTSGITMPSSKVVAIDPGTVSLPGLTNTTSANNGIFFHGGPQNSMGITFNKETAKFWSTGQMTVGGWGGTLSGTPYKPPAGLTVTTTTTNIDLFAVATGPVNALSYKFKVDGTSTSILTSSFTLGGMSGAIQSTAAPAGDSVLHFNGQWFLGGDAAGGAGTPGGNSGQIQYNNASAFGGVANTFVTASSSSFDQTVSMSSAQFRGTPYFSVRAYGAVGDGSTDDTSAFTAAITSASAVGGTVWIDSTFNTGGYVITSTLTLASNVSIQCAQGAVIRRNTVARALFDVQGSTVKVCGCTFDGNALGGGPAFILNGSSDVAITDNVFRNWLAVGAVNSANTGLINGPLGGYRRIKIKDNRFMGVPDASINIYPSANVSEVWIEDNYIEATETDWPGIVIANNHASSNFINRFTISGNIIRAKPTGIYLTGNGVPNEITISGNQVSVTASGGATAGYNFFGCLHCSITGNLYEDNGFGHFNAPGFALHDMAETTVTGNTVHVTAGDGDGIQALDSKRCIFNGNTIGGDVSAGVIQNGFDVAHSGFVLSSAAGYPDMEDNIISNNLIIAPPNFTGVGIQVYCSQTGPLCSHTVISGNRIRGFSITNSTGILLTTGGGGVMSYNSIYNNNISSFSVGVAILGTTSNTVVGNNTFDSIRVLNVNDSGTNSQINTHTVQGSGSLTSATPSTLAVTFTEVNLFTAGKYQCVANDQTTQTNPIKVTYSGNTVTFTGPNTVTDTVGYICTGY